MKKLSSFREDAGCGSQRFEPTCTLQDWIPGCGLVPEIVEESFDDELDLRIQGHQPEIWVAGRCIAPWFGWDMDNFFFFCFLLLFRSILK